ncbi:MAG: hypothetical protein LUF30_04785, partial [Lachnospiraceae bacterium]|nr:hypothetical protein [Lachnospiraceae bacterium]
VGNRYDPNVDTEHYGSVYGQNLGIRDVSQVTEDSMVTITEGVSSIENADLDAYLEAQFGEGFDWEQIKADYVAAGAYVISGSRVLDWDAYADLQPGEMADDTAEHPVEVGGRLYVHMKDAQSADKYYLLVSSSKDVEIGEALFTDGEGGYGLLDDKYVATHMANSLEDGGAYSYFAHDLGTSGGKIGLQEAGSEGQSYIYVICEAPGDYYQRLANEEAGYEERLDGDDRPYMPANNSSSTDGTWLNEWHNTKYSITFSFENTAAEGEDPVLELVDDYGFDVDAEALAAEATEGRDGTYSASVNISDLADGDTFTIPVSALVRDSSVNDGVIRTGGTEGDSNTRLGGYSGQNIVVAKFEVTVSSGKATIAYATNEAVYGSADTEGSGQVVTDYFENVAEYHEDGFAGELEIEAGVPWYFHTQMADCSGRGGFTNGLITAEISGDDGIVEYNEETGILTGLAAGTVEATFTVAEGRLTDRSTGEDTGLAYEGASITLTITVA